MREHGLLAPTRARRVLGPRNHDGTITVDAPDEMWGTDLTTTMTTRDGQVGVFIAVDHCTAECIGIHAAKRATRYEALEPIRQGVREHFGAYGPDVAAGLALRHDHGTQYTSDLFQDELAFLGIESSPSFVQSPRATVAPSASSEPSRSSCCGSRPSRASTSSSSRCTASGAATTSAGSSRATATVLPPSCVKNFLH